jgi:monomeric sarcosine oxidase
MGVAAAWALARRGCSVRVLERFTHVNELGSHGGFTRIIRQAYHEGSDYVRLVQAADRLWTQLEGRAGEQLLVRCGLLEFGPPRDEGLLAAMRALAAHGIEHEICEAGPAQQRWPIQIPEDWVACLTPQSGYLRVNASLDALRREAEAHGASFEYGVRVNEVICGGGQPRVLLEEGQVIAADAVVVAAGAYVGKLLPGFFREAKESLFRAQRRVLAWTRPEAEDLAAVRDMPVWGAFVPEGFFYGFPYNEEGVAGFKHACHEARAMPWMDVPVDPDRVDREVSERDLAPLRNFLDRYVPAASGPVVEAKVCLYGSTPSWDFLVDTHPADRRVIVASGFSGHGFKFAPEIGELVADLVQTGDDGRGLPIFRRSHHLRGP